MTVDDSFGVDRLCDLIGDPLNFVVFHLARNSLLCIVRDAPLLIIQQLDLDWFRRIIDPKVYERKKRGRRKVSNYI